MSELYKIHNCLETQISLVNDVLTRYVRDEAGESQKQKYMEMTWEDKISLLTNTLSICANWEDFETDLIVNFDYSNY